MPQALPIPGPSPLPSPTPGTTPGGRGGLLRVVSNEQLDQHEAAVQAAKAIIDPASASPATDLNAYIRAQWTVMRDHRNMAMNGGSINDRLLRAQRMYEGEYDPGKLAEIGKFGGSQVYARIVAGKCRMATSLLRDVYLGPERPWEIQPEEDPPVPPDVMANISKLVSLEVASMNQQGQPVPASQTHSRLLGLVHAAREAARRQAQQRADAAENKVEDILVEGKFYDALADFMVDLPLYPFAVLKGPVVRMVQQLVWDDAGQPSMQTRPQMFWERVSPFNIYWSPGADAIEDADILERHRFTRSQLNGLLGVPGYDEKAIREVLQDYRKGLRDWLDSADTEQAQNEGRENPAVNRSQYIDALEFTGMVPGEMLRESGMTKKQIPDPDLDYMVTSWVIGRHTIKTLLNPSPRQRHAYFVTSYVKVPGTIAGHALPDMLEDIQEVANATYRALVNNQSIASGPQVVVNEELLAPTENGDELYPWKRWRVTRDPMDLSSNSQPITFFQPQSNASELMQVLQAMNVMADEASGMPRYMGGSSQNGGGATRTASGLSMLMQNAEKVLQAVAANVDEDVVDPALSGLYDMIVLTDVSRMLTGEERVRVRGVNVAVQKDSERAKQLQFLQITANPMDAEIVGQIGRARVLRAVAQNMGMPDDVVPDDATLQQKIDAQRQLQAAAIANAPPGVQGQGGQPTPSSPGPGGGGKSGGGAPASQGAPLGLPPGAGGAPNPASQAQGAQAPTAKPTGPGPPAVNHFQAPPGVPNG